MTDTLALAHTVLDAVTHAVVVEEKEATAVPVRRAEAERAPVPVVKRLGVCVGERESTRAEGDTDALTVCDGDAVCVGVREGEPEGEGVAPAEPVRARLSVETGENVGDCVADGVDEVHMDSVKDTVGLPEVVSTAEAEGDALGHALPEATLDGVEPTVMVTVAQLLTLAVPHAVA